MPAIPGTDAPGVFTVRNVQNAEAIRAWILTREPKTAVVVGSGFIGLEMAEQLTESGLAVTIVERLPQVMPALDPDMAFRVEEELVRRGVSIHLGRSVTAIEASDDTVTGTMAAVNYFKGADGLKVISVDGSASIGEVTEAIMKQL